MLVSDRPARDNFVCPCNDDNPFTRQRGDDDIRHLVLPDFFFHISIAHAILRHLGAKIGKHDYLGNLTQQSRGVYS